MPPSEATRHEPLPLGVDAMPTIGAFSDIAPIDTDGIDCSPSVMWTACAPGRAAAWVAVDGCAPGDVAPAEFRVVAKTVPVTSRIAARAIHLDALRVGSTVCPLVALAGPTQWIGTLRVGVEGSKVAGWRPTIPRGAPEPGRSCRSGPTFGAGHGAVGRGRFTGRRSTT